MLNSILLATVISQGAGAPAQTTPAALISRMFAKYAAATTMVGQITFEQSAAGVKKTVVTKFQFEKPEKIYVHQTADFGDTKVKLLVSNGTVFSYDLPRTLPGSEKRLLENVVQPNGSRLTIGDMYIAATYSLHDKSVPLDVAIAHNSDLSFIRNQWATLVDGGQVQFNGQVARKVGGQWREYGTAPISGEWEMLINAEAELLYYAVHEKLSLPRGDGTLFPPVDVTSAWTAKLKPGAPVDQSLFAVRR